MARAVLALELNERIGFHMLRQVITTPIRLILQTILGKERYRRAKHKHFWVKKRGLRYHPIYGYREVEGWLAEKEAFALHDIAKGLRNHCVIVEIGSWLGKSSVILSQAIKRKRGAKLFCIDPLNADSDPESVGIMRATADGMKSNTLFQKFSENVHKYGVPRRIKALQGYSHEFSSAWTRPIDLLFIDGNHSYEAARRDFEEWSRFVKPGRFLAMHDVSENPSYPHKGPLRVVNEVIAPTREWVQTALVAYTFFARKLPNSSG